MFWAFGQKSVVCQTSDYYGAIRITRFSVRTPALQKLRLRLDEKFWFLFVWIHAICWFRNRVTVRFGFGNCVKHVTYAETFICLCSVTQPCLFVWSISCILVSACERGNSTRDERVQVGDNVTLSDCKDLGKQSIPDSSKVTASLSSEGSTHILIKGDVATNKTSAYKCHPEDMKNLGIDHCLLEIVAYRSSDGHWAFHANITFGSKSGEGLPSWLTLTYAYHDGVNIEQLYTEFNIYYGETISTSWPFQSFLRGDGKPSS